MTERDHQNNIERANDVRAFLESIGWDEAIRPALEAQTKIYQKRLVNLLLGLRTGKVPNVDSEDLTPEQLAGRIHGMEYITSLLERILLLGDKSKEQIARVVIGS